MPESDVLQMASRITAAEALAVFRRKLPGAHAEVTSVAHPFWWVRVRAETTGLFSRRSAVRAKQSAGNQDSDAGQRMDILVNAISGKGFIADFEPRGQSCESAEWTESIETGTALDGPLPAQTSVRASAAGRTAHALARTKVVKTVKLGMRIAIDDLGAPHRVLKPNWLVTGTNEKYSATMLVDGLDSSHYLVRVNKVG